MKRLCHRCHHPWTDSCEPGFNNTCEKCGMALHACSNCDHYRPTSPRRCSLPNTEDMLDPSASNRCAEFAFELKDEAAAAAEAMAPAPSRRSNTAQRKWDDLFGA